MKRILLLVLLVTTIAQSQEKTFESEVKKISKKIDKITKQQKDSLKNKVKEINLKIDKNELTSDEAISLKKTAAFCVLSDDKNNIDAPSQQGYWRTFLTSHDLSASLIVIMA